MPRKTQPIPVNQFGDESASGVSIERFAFDDLPELGEWQQSERHDRHSFFLIESGNVTLEVDFEQYQVQSPAIVYLHPDQVHRIIGFEQVAACALAVTDEALNPEYLQLLEELNPAAPVSLNAKASGLLSGAVDFCLQMAGRQRDPLYNTLLKNQGNTLVGLIISCMAQTKFSDKLTRPEKVTKSFRAVLSHHFKELKRPADYAEKLNLSSAYLNECVKLTTGQPVSVQIQQRVILEAKRLIYHSDQSLKEIAAALGYDDYPYFSRLFIKVAGFSPVTFRNKNRD